MNFLKSLKNKFFVLMMAFGLAVNNAMAATPLKFDASTGSFTGEIDVTPYLAGVSLIITALAGFWCFKKVIGLFGR